jgi:transcriptional regulator with GAF, ATPase, and Fis domain
MARPLGSEDDLSTIARAVVGPAPAWRVRRLVVVEGPDIGAAFAIDPNAPTKSLVGTSLACGVRLRDPTVSRRHASIEPVAQGCRVVDLGSTNGTSIDGVVVSDAFFRPGQALRCGSTTFQLERSSSAEAEALPEAAAFGRIVGASLPMRRLYPLCLRLATSRVPVVIEGETGTGKENLAEALHEVGGAAGDFVVFDCTAVSPSLVEAELFGHERGAFTGAVASRAGVFEQADKGTLLIDEIGDLDLPLQAKLLRVIDRGELRRVGGQRSIRVDVRVLAATRRNLDKEVAAGRFRDDLFHRLAIARVELPPLRERHGDVLLLARAFASSMGARADAIPQSWLEAHADYGWPGNVRELKNAVARLIALGEDAVAQQARPPSLAPPAVSARGGDWMTSLVSGRMPFAIARRRVIDEFERRYTESVLAAHDGNVTRAAEASGVALRYFQVVKARSKDG